MTNTTAHESKVALRKAVRAARKLGFQCGEAHSIRLIEIIVRNEIHIVSAYEEFDNEPSLVYLRDWCSLNGIELLLPSIANDTELTWSDDQPLSAAQLIIMPALAAGRDGSRLGRGKGYFDRAVAGLNTPRVVVVHDSELYDSVPADEFDQTVSMVVTCSECVDIDGRLN